jgi:hypothetical protein
MVLERGEKLKLIRFEIGEANCNICGTPIKNIYVVNDSGIEKTIGCECITKVLGNLPKEYKNAKSIVYNRQILEGIVKFKPTFEKTNLYTALILGERKITDKAVLLNILIQQWYKLRYEHDNNIYTPNILEDRKKSRSEQIEDYKREIEKIKNKYKTYFMSDYVDEKFLDKLIEYANERFPVWGWQVKYQIKRSV